MVRLDEELGGFGAGWREVIIHVAQHVKEETHNRLIKEQGEESKMGRLGVASGRGLAR